MVDWGRFVIEKRQKSRLGTVRNRKQDREEPQAKKQK